jgi:tetratricopeptide (TPR) repeat protein
MATTEELLSMAVVHHRAGRLEEAEHIYRQVLVADPNQPDALHLLGVIARRAGNSVLAVEYLQRATERSPLFAAAHYNLGNVFRDTKRLDEAAASYRRAIDLEPDLAEAHSGLGTALLELGDWQEAANCFRRTIELRPNDVNARNSLGVILQDHAFAAEAIECFRAALAIRPDNAEARYNLGRAVHQIGQYDEAQDLYRAALKLKPDLAYAHAGLGMVMLLRGDYDNGWVEYEWRWKTGSLRGGDYRQPRWDGQQLDGRTILLHAEQGFGDTIQFIRYAAAVKSLGGTVLVQCQKPILNLLKNCNGIHQLIGEGDELPPFDTHASLLSLPRLLQTRLDTIPNKVPYLAASAELVEYWRARLADVRPLRIGVNWRGRQGTGAFRQRDIPLEFFIALAQLPGVRLINLQKDGQQELAAVTNSTVVELGNTVDTERGAFMDTAAIMKNLDLVITSDTAIPHLAGALGVSVWLALPYVPDWRWLLDRSDSPWYPTMQLFRQKSPGNWADVFAEMRIALHERVRETDSAR